METKMNDGPVVYVSRYLAAYGTQCGEPFYVAREILKIIDKQETQR